MRRLIFFTALISLGIYFLAPSATLAASCKCEFFDTSQSDSSGWTQNNCRADITADSCYTSDPNLYRNCYACSDNACNANCKPPENTTIDQTCTTDAECAQNVGKASCVGGKCSLDPLALQAYQNSHISFLGISQDVKLKSPLLEIRIPGLSFSDINSTLDEDGYIHVPYVAEYLAGIYKLALGLSSLVAVIVIILNGFRVVVSAGGEDKNNGLKHVGQALVGLVILWGSYALFYTINPAITQFQALRIRYVEPIAEEDEEEVPSSPAPVAAPANISGVTGDNLLTAKGVQVADDLLPSLQAAANSLQSQYIQLYVASGMRSLDYQITLIRQNCTNPPGASSCSPKPGKPLTCILKDNNPSNCPHTTGRAVDVWGMKDGQQCVLQKQCQSDPTKDKCRQDPCQAAVIQAMKEQGFCNLQSEAWHFEKPKMSAKCI